MTTGTRVMNMRQVRLGLRDKQEKRHWLEGRCWCDEVHDGSETGITFTAAPWDESRDGEIAR